MSDIEKLVRHRMQEEFAKGTSAEQITQIVRDIFNGTDTTRSAQPETKSHARRS